MIINGKTTPSYVILTFHELQKLPIFFFYFLILSQYETEKHSKNKRGSSLKIVI